MWSPVWHQAVTRSLLSGKVFGRNRTVIFSVHAPFCGNRLRIRFSNRFGGVPYDIGAVRIVNNGNTVPVTLNGKESFSIPVGSCPFSDEIPLSVSAGSDIEIRLFYTSPVNDCNMIEEGASLLKGNQTEAVSFKSKKPFISKVLGAYNAVPAVEYIEIDTDETVHSIVAFGDSITAMSRWTKPLARRLEEAYHGEFVLLNSGISGNCLLYEPKGFFGPVFGEKGISRFQRDVLDIPGLHTVIISLGVNDVSYFTDQTRELINLQTFSQEITKMVNVLHDKNVRAAIQTITPRLGVSRTMGKFTPEMEELRLEINRWIRSAGIFDYVFDAEAVVREEHGGRLYYAEGLHQGDRLHPNAAGGQKLAEAFDLEKLTGRKLK